MSSARGGKRWVRPLALVLAFSMLPACDQEPLVVGHDTRSIIGGTPTPESVLPSVGALVLQLFLDKQSFCTATVISDRLLLTAAHCIETWQNLSAQNSSAKLGFYNGSAVTNSSALLSVASTQAHPKYAGGQPPGYLAEYNDIGIARLAEPTAIPPMKIIRPSEESALVVGASVLIAGYGLSDPYGQASGGTKRHGTTLVGGLGSAELYILGDSRPQKCTGDSGGPTIIEVDGAAGKEQRLVGVASRTQEGCVGGALDTRVDHYLSWIESLGTLPCDSASSPDCPPAPPASKNFGEPCTKSEECVDKLCVLSGDTKVCSKPCVVQNDTCPSGTKCTAAGGGSEQGACLKAPAAPPSGDPCDPSKGGCGEGLECVSSPTGAHFCAPISNPPAAKKGGCSLSLNGRPAPLGAPFLVLSMTVLMLLLRRRREP